MQEDTTARQKGFAAELLLVGVVLLAAAAYFVLRLQSPEPAPTITEPRVTVPSDAVQIVNCIPKIGEIWVRVADLHHGPYYTTHEGEVIALGYMYYPDELPGEELAKALPQERAAVAREAAQKGLKESLQIDIPSLDYEYWASNWVPAHPGMEEGAHYDMYFYLVKPEVVSQVCPDASPQEFYTEELIKSAAEAGIPLPEDMQLPQSPQE